MSKSGIRPLWKDSDVSAFFEHFEEEADRVVFEMLSAAGEKYIQVARKKGSYKDHTGNLRSSIGYIIYKDGSEEQSNFEKSPIGTDRQTGVIKARMLANKIALELDTTWVLVLTAGMEYAAVVEAKGYDVSTTGCLKAEEYLAKVSMSLFNKLKNKKR